MKALKSLLFIASFIFLTGCMNDTSETQEKTVDETIINRESEPTPTIESSTATLPYIVQYDETTGRFNIIENPASETLPVNSEQIISALKNKYPEIDLEARARKGDTLEVEITNASYLTRSMGSAGANAFLAEATYGFTSLDSITVVNFMFEPGDHAMPGLYDRKYFDDFH